MLPNESRLPTAQDIRAYLAHTGWSEGPPGPVGTLWTYSGITLGVPSVEDELVKSNIISRLAAENRRPTADLVEEIKYFSVDVTNFRAVNDRLIFDSIPLSAAISITQNARALLRSTGTTAFKIQGDLKGHYSRLGDDVMRSARMGHTKPGSFIIPVLVPLSTSEPVPVDSLPLVHIETSAPEPHGRRVMRTFAQALEAVAGTIIEPAVEPTMDRLHHAVQLGVSRELCVALGKILAEPTVGEFESTFRWAPAVKTPSRIPTSITLPADAEDLVKSAARKLQDVRIEPTRVLSGNIIELRHVTNDEFGYVTISTARNGRPVEVRIRVPYRQYLEALQWHADRRILIVEGDIEGGRGERLHIDSPVQCTPMDELFPTSLRTPTVEREETVE